MRVDERNWRALRDIIGKMGTHASQEGAMLHAERFIDEVIKHRKRIARIQSQI